MLNDIIHQLYILYFEFHIFELLLSREDNEQDNEEMRFELFQYELYL
jgi:hypothetical protein